MVRANSTGLFNFVNNKKDLISQNWFDIAEDFQKRQCQNGEIQTIAKVIVNNVGYWLYPDGKIEKINDNGNKK